MLFISRYVIYQSQIIKKGDVNAIILIQRFLVFKNVIIIFIYVWDKLNLYTYINFFLEVDYYL